VLFHLLVHLFFGVILLSAQPNFFPFACGWRPPFSPRRGSLFIVESRSVWPAAHPLISFESLFRERRTPSFSSSLWILGSATPHSCLLLPHGRYTIPSSHILGPPSVGSAQLTFPVVEDRFSNRLSTQLADLGRLFIMETPWTPGRARMPAQS